MKENICVLGMGSWGTALSISLANKGYSVKLWGRDTDYLREVRKTRTNKKYLPDSYLPENIELFEEIEDAIQGSSTIILSVVSQATREILNKIKDHISKEVLIVNTSKGIEKDTLKLASEIMSEVLPNNKFIVLSGPSHAEEVNKGLPTTLVAASRSKQAAERIQELFLSPRLRVYTNPDTIGVEIGGALKNIIALGAGISDGLGYGDNAKAALMTRGIVEIARLGIKMGAHEKTFSGLTGIGDLIVTCTSLHSRNRRCGILIGQGLPYQEAIKEIGMVVEGVIATEAAFKLSQIYGVEMPITTQLYKLLKDEVAPKETVKNLMMRQKTHEAEEISENLLWGEE